MPPYEAILDLMSRWIKYENYFDIEELFKKNSWNNISIYGGGHLGKTLFERLLITDISVACIIDKNPELRFPYDVDIYLPERFLDSHVDVDAIFVTAVDFIGIFDTLSPHVTCPIVSLYSLIVDPQHVESLQIAISTIEQAKAHLFLLDITIPCTDINNLSPLETVYRLKGVPFKYGEPRIKLIDRLFMHYINDLSTGNEDKSIAEPYKNFPSIKMKSNESLHDVTSRCCNIINGIRFTADTPDVYDNTIHFFGNCIAFGGMAEDKNTIESQLQRLINSSDLPKKFRVLNHSISRGMKNIITQLKKQQYRKNDIIIWIDQEIFDLRHYTDSERIHFFTLDSAFNRPHDYGEVLMDCYHLNHRGYRLLADKIFSILSDMLRGSDAFAHPEEHRGNKMSFRKELVPRKRLGKGGPNAPPNMNPSLDECLARLRGEKVACQGVVGSIVMNCDPFTLGHRFLIEEALRQCDFLHVFVVEEDRSFFPFADRLQLVQAGTGDLENLKVLPSGSFMISMATFPGYFTKNSAKDAKIDASYDIQVFADSIAPVLNISRRFVGEEPLDPVTRQYNLAMLESLPHKGVEVVVIPRKQQTDGVPISASRVRTLHQDRDFEAIRKIVPEKTLEYLKDFWVGGED